MIDWHSHILPGMDDGSRNLAESESLLQKLSAQGVTIVAATPHFYANDEEVEAFLERRTRAMEELQTCNQWQLQILPGAEVRYYPGICRMEQLNRLCITGSEMLLLEMPMETWTEYTVRELVELASSRRQKLILAHVERYRKLQKEAVWERLLESGIEMQVNASIFTEWKTRHRAISMLKRGAIQFLGSDCHNTGSRPPRIGEAYAIIEKKLGGKFLSQMHEYGLSKLIHNN